MVSQTVIRNWTLPPPLAAALNVSIQAQQAVQQ